MPSFLESRAVVLGLRIAQLVLSIIVLGLTAYGMSSQQRLLRTRCAPC